MGAILHAVSVPPNGGDTLFADMAAVYDGLDAELRARADALMAVHDFARAFGLDLTDDASAEMRRTYPPARHPVIRTHPETGRRLVYVNRFFVDSHRRARRGRHRRTDRRAVRPGRRARVPVSVPVAGPLGRVLGQPGGAALRLLRLLARRAHHGTCLDRRRCATLIGPAARPPAARAPGRLPGAPGAHLRRHISIWTSGRHRNGPRTPVPPRDGLRARSSCIQVTGRVDLESRTMRGTSRKSVRQYRGRTWRSRPAGNLRCWPRRRSRPVGRTRPRCAGTGRGSST